MTLGVDRLLTSGQKKTAVEGIPLLKQLTKQARGRISIMPGGGIRDHNVAKILKLDIQEIHTGSSVQVASKMKPASQVKVGPEDTQQFHTFVDPEAIRSIVALAKS